RAPGRGGRAGDRRRRGDGPGRRQDDPARRPRRALPPGRGLVGLMRVGIGLPTTIAGAPASLTPAWARRAEAAGFASLGVHDRLAYDGPDALTALAAAAAVTERVRLAALVIVGPARGGPAVLGKQAAT